MTVMVAEDRSMCVPPNQVVRTAWVDIDLCRLSFRLPMSPEAVEKKYRRLFNLGECAPWPPIVGHWEDGRFVVCDGRHDYLAALMIGRDKLFVCWLEPTPEALRICGSGTATRAHRGSKPKRKVWCRLRERPRAGFRSTSTCLQLPLPSIRNHQLGEPRLLGKTMPVDPRCGFDQFPAPIQ